MNESHHGPQPSHRRLRMLLLIVGTVVSVSVWFAVLIWNGCVASVPHVGAVDSSRAPRREMIPTHNVSDRESNRTP